jgi:DNA-binding XRE family transcriptional regulator
MYVPRLYCVLLYRIMLCFIKFYRVFKLDELDLFQKYLNMSADNWWKKTRVKLGLRKTELAKKTGLSTRTILRLESGDESITEETKNKVKIVLKAK